MDNLSHSLVGLTVGEFIHRSLPEESDDKQNRLRQRLLLVTCTLASSFPDLDLILTPLLPAPLGYLLHHRGHTHTILYAIPQALLLFGMIWLCWPSARRLLKTTTSARKGFIYSLAAGFGLHLCMDFLNSYGIHPFHPFHSNWFYGDMIFIVEPFFWITFGIPMAMIIRRRLIKYPLIALLLGVPLFFTIDGFLSWYSFLALAVTALVLGFEQSKSGARGKRGLIFAGMIGVSFVGLQGFASHQARNFLREVSPFVDAALTPYPTNPFCWMYASIESDESVGTYHLRRGHFSLAPEFTPVIQCPSRFSENETVIESTDALSLSFHETGDLNHLRRLKNKNCYFEAWLRFARIPSVKNNMASDLRYSRSGQSENFTTMNVDDFKSQKCPDFVPQWNFPRADLFISN